MFVADSRPVIRFGLRNNSMHINQAAMNAIGNKPYVQFLWNEKYRVLFIAGLDKKVRDSFSLIRRSGEKPNGTCCEYVFQRKAFADAVILRMKWDANDSYKVFGEYIPERRQVAFRLDEAFILNSETEELPLNV